MYAKSLSLLALAGTAVAQTQSLNATLAGIPSLSNLTALLSATPGILSTLNSLVGVANITLLAPNNEAIAQLLTTDAGKALTTEPGALAAVLTYHVLNGSYPASKFSSVPAFAPSLLNNQTYENVTGGQVVEGVTVGNQVELFSGLLQNSTVTQADIKFNGGIIHVINKVLTLPADALDTASALGLTSFRGAVNATGLANTVNETPDLTIFAPTNQAFASIGSVLANATTADLKNILTYHVIKGTVGYSSDLTNGQTLTTVNGKTLTITLKDGNVFVNAAKVITPNVLIANGVIHVIDDVLNPSNTMGPASGATAGAIAFAAATPVGTSDPFTSGQPTSNATLVPSGAGPQPTAPETVAAAMPHITGSVGYGALLGAGAAMVFL